MMPVIEMVPARLQHCGRMARYLRHEHRAIIDRMGANAHYELRGLYDRSDPYFRRAWLIDGRLAAMAFIQGSLLMPIGFVGAAFTQEALRYPLAIVRGARAYLDEAMEFKRELITTVVGGDEPAMRLATFLGFHCSHQGEGVRAYSRKGRGRLRNYLKADPELRLPIPGGYMIGLGYHNEEHV